MSNQYYIFTLISYIYVYYQRASLSLLINNVIVIYFSQIQRVPIAIGCTGTRVSWVATLHGSVSTTTLVH